MRYRSLIQIPLIGTLIIAALLTPTVTASAGAGAYGTDLGYTNTSCYNAPFFGSVVGSAADRGGGRVSIQYRFRHYAFVYLPCSVTVTANWRNLDTGESGSVSVPLDQGWDFALPMNPGTGGYVEFFTSPGLVSITTVTDRPHQADAAFEFTVH